MTRRMHRRFEFQTPIKVTLIEQDMKSVPDRDVVLLTISQGGLSFKYKANTEIKPGVNHVTLNLYPPGAKHPISVFGKVLWRKSYANEAGGELGLIGMRISEEDLPLFKETIKTAAPVSDRRETAEEKSKSGFTKRSPVNSRLLLGGESLDPENLIDASKTCLVTGATGFLGWHLAMRLAKAKRLVRILIRDEKKAQDFSDFPNVEKCMGDIRDPVSLKRAVHNVDYVFHCAALVSDWGSAKDFVDINIEGTRNMAEACLHESLVRFVHISTTDVYGYPRNPEENKDLRPTKRGFSYNDSKLEGEQVVLEYCRRGLPVTVVRPATIYGARSLIPVKEFAKALKNGDLPFMGPANVNAGLCYVENLVDAILLAATNAEAVGKCYDVTDDWPITWKDFILTLSKVLRVPPPKLRIPYRLAYAIGWLMEHLTSKSSSARPMLTRTAVEVLCKSQGFSPSRARTELKHFPRIGPMEAMARIEEWLKMEV